MGFEITINTDADGEFDVTSTDKFFTMTERANSGWILEDGTWNDQGAWDDDEVWNDG